MKEPLLEVHGLKKYFPVTAGIFRQQVGEVKAVDGVDFTLYPGEVLGVVGESGSGKSTLGRAVIRLIEPTRGSIAFDGRDLCAMDSAALLQTRKSMQMIFQDPYASLNPRKTIGEALREPLLYHALVASREEADDMATAILSRIGLSEEAMHKYPHQFSGGQQQRICIGRALLFNPRLIVCDEVLSALDVSVQAQILNMLNELKKTLHLSYLFITHDLSIVRYISDRVLVLYLGKVMETASVDDLFRNPKHPYTQALLSAVPKSHPLEKKERLMLKGEIPSSRNPPSGCPFRTRCPFAQPICAEIPPRKVVEGESDHSYHCIL